MIRSYTFFWKCSHCDELCLLWFYCKRPKCAKTTFVVASASSCWGPHLNGTGWGSQSWHVSVQTNWFRKDKSACFQRTGLHQVLQGIWLHNIVEPCVHPSGHSRWEKVNMVCAIPPWQAVCFSCIIHHGSPLGLVFFSYINFQVSVFTQTGDQQLPPTCLEIPNKERLTQTQSPLISSSIHWGGVPNGLKITKVWAQNAFQTRTATLVRWHSRAAQTSARSGAKRWRLLRLNRLRHFAFQNGFCNHDAKLSFQQRTQHLFCEAYLFEGFPQFWHFRVLEFIPADVHLKGEKEVRTGCEPESVRESLSQGSAQQVSMSYLKSLLELVPAQETSQ